MQMEQNEVKPNKVLPVASDSFYDKVGIFWGVRQALATLFLSNLFYRYPPLVFRVAECATVLPL